MTTVTFDTLAYANKLENAGFTRQQAEAQAQAQKEAFDEMMQAKELTTKKDLADTKHEMIKWIVGVSMAQTALLVAIMAFFM